MTVQHQLQGQLIVTPTQHFILPDTSLKEATFPLVDVLLDPGHKGAALKGRGMRYLLREPGYPERHCVQYSQLRSSVPHPGVRGGDY